MTHNSSSNANGSIVIEAEALNFDDDFVLSSIDSNASGGQIIRVRGDRQDGDARTVFNGADGLYDLTLHAYDENDGNGQLTVWVNDRQVSTTVLNRNLGSGVPGVGNRVQIVIDNLGLKRGDRIRIEGKRGGSELTSLDKIVFTPRSTPVTAPGKIVIEAEDLDYDNDFYLSRGDSGASGGQIIRVRGDRQDGDARTVFNGADGTYLLTLDAYDENDGRGRLTVWVNGRQISATTLNKNLGSAGVNSQTRVQIEIADVALKRGDVIRIEAKRDGGERTSLDKITFDPVGSQAVSITSNGGGDVAAVTVNEGLTAVTNFEVNVGDAAVTYRINDGADRNLFTIDPLTGQLAFKEAPDWESPQDADANNVYEVNVVAEGNGSGDGQFVTVVVNNLENPDPNDPPAEFSIEAEALVRDRNFYTSTIDRDASGGSIIRARQGRTATAKTTFNGTQGAYRLTVDAYDENDGTGSLLVKINGRTISTTVLNKNLGSGLPDARSRVQITTDEVTLTPGDVVQLVGISRGNELTSIDKLTFTPSVANAPVTITSNGGGDSAVVRVDEGLTAVTDFDVNVGDNSVVYSINAGADKDLFTIDPITGQLAFKDAPDWEAPADEGGNNVYEVNVIAVGENGGDGQFLSIIVNNLENPDPTPIGGPVEIISNNNPNAPGNSFSFVAINENIRTVTDFEIAGSQTGVTYSLNDGADKDLFWINPTTGVLSFKQTPDWETPLDADGDNNYEVNVLAARDGQFDAQFLTVQVANTSETNVPNPVSVYLMAGQSNLVGEALRANLPASFAAPFPAAQIWGVNSKTFVDLAPGFDGQTTTVGPEYSFGRTIVERTNDDVYLIKYGLGATSLAVDWNPSGVGGSTGRQFNTWIDTVNEALDTLTVNGVTYELDGLVWQQGESDTYDPGFANAYRDNLTDFIGTVRDFYGENLDVSIGLIRSDLPTTPADRLKVQDAQRAVASSLGRVNLVNTDALTPASTVLIDGDPTHYSAAGQVLLGEAYGDSFAV